MKSLERVLPLLHSGFFRGMGAVSQLLLAAWVSRSMPKDESGRFLFYVACFTFASPLVLLGTQQFAMRHLSQFKDVTREASLVSRFLAWRSARTLLAMACVLLPTAVLVDTTSWIRNSASGVDHFASWLMLAAILGGGSLIIAAHFHGIRRLASSLIFSHIAIPTITVILFAVFSVNDAQDAIKTHCLASLIALAIGVLVWAQTFKIQLNDTNSGDQETGVDVGWSWRACMDFWLLNAFILVVNWSPLIYAGFVIDPGKVAELNISQRAGNLMNFILIVISFTFAPRFRYAWAQNDLIGLRNKVARCAVYLFAIGTPVFFVVTLGSSFIMRAFGPDYAGGAVLLCVFASAQYFNVITGSVNQILTMCDRERTLRNICATSALTSATLGYFLVNAWSAMGAAVAVAIALVLQNLLAVWAVKKHLGFWVFDPRTVAKPSIADSASAVPT